jgi:hypothetical protein
MKNFIIGASISFLFGIVGLAVLVNSLPEKSFDVVRNCTWSQVKDCYSGSPSPNNPCCPPKYMENVPQEMTKDCSWGQVKDCYSGSPSPNNPCCPPKYMEEAPQEVAVNCTWDQVKLCYLLGPHVNNPCCPPKYRMMEEVVL